MKFRTDFVTNSSSSSFVLVIRIGLKNGRTLKFVGDSGIGEGDETYYQLAALKSPEELSRSASIEDLVQALQSSVVEEDAYDWETDTHTDKKVLNEETALIKGLRKVKSMDDISTITINGDLYGRDDDEQQYWHYTYYRDRGITVYDEGGEDFYQEGTGGRINRFSTKKALEGKNYGEYRGRGKGFDKDVEPDEEMFQGKDNEGAITQGHMLKGTKLVKFIDNEKYVVSKGTKTKVQFDSGRINDMFSFEGDYLAKYDKAYPSYQYYDAVEYKQLADKLVEEGQIESGERIPLDTLSEKLKPLEPKKVLECMEKFAQEVIDQWNEVKLTQIIDSLPRKKKDGTLVKNRVTQYYFTPWVRVWVSSGFSGLVDYHAMEAKSVTDSEVMLRFK